MNKDEGTQIPKGKTLVVDDQPAHQPPLISDQPSPDQAARATERAAYLDRLRQYLRDPAFRATEGFPFGDDEAILALSDPPYYTACPNPFLPEILARWQEARDAMQEAGSKMQEAGSKKQEARGRKPISNLQLPISNLHSPFSYSTPLPLS